MSSMLENFREWLDSPEGEKAMEEFKHSLDVRDMLIEKYVTILTERISKLSDEELDKEFQKLFTWEDEFEERYYQRNIITQSNILSYIFDAWVELGEEAEIDGDEGYKFRNYTFVLICGQGCFTRIYRGDEIIYQTN